MRATETGGPAEPASADGVKLAGSASMLALAKEGAVTLSF